MAKRKINPLRLDPTRTTMQVLAFESAIKRRMAALRRAIRHLVVDSDAFGIRADREAERRAAKGPAQAATSATIPAGVVFNTRWRFETDDAKVDGYRKWLKDQVDHGLLAVDPKNQDRPWVASHVESVYRKGLIRAYTDAHKIGGDEMPYVQGGKKEFLRMAFAGPVSNNRIKAISTRTFSELRGITAQMDTEMTRILTSGIANGTGAEVLAKELTDTVDGMTRKRARRIARTELAYAHSEGQLDSFEMMNIDEVGVMAEWSTAHDDKVCPLCQPMEGVVLTVKEARGLLPRHPNCRCAWIPANMGEHLGGTTKTTHAGPGQGLSAPGTLPTGKTTGQVWAKDEVASRIRESIKKEHPKLATKAARAASKWLGADATISGKLKPGTAKWAAAKKEKAREARKAARIAGQEAAIAKAEKAAAHSAKVKLGLAKKKHGLSDNDIDYRGGVPGVSGATVRAKAEAAGVDLTPADTKAVLGAVPGPNQVKVAAQMDTLETTIATKKAEAAIARKVQADAAAVASAKAAQETETLKALAQARAQSMKGAGADIQSLDHADFAQVPGWGTGGPKKQSYGVVLFDDEGRVLLRKPTPDPETGTAFGGVEWTFAKGGVEGGDLPATTALKELGEETGHKAALHDILPGSYGGTTTKNNYFIGKSAGYDTSLMDVETEAVKWMTYEEAVAAIKLSPNSTARARDMAVLSKAFGVMADGDGSTFKDLVADGAAKLKAAKKAAPTKAGAVSIRDRIDTIKGKYGLTDKHIKPGKDGALFDTGFSFAGAKKYIKDQGGDIDDLTPVFSVKPGPGELKLEAQKAEIDRLIKTKGAVPAPATAEEFHDSIKHLYDIPSEGSKVDGVVQCHQGVYEIKEVIGTPKGYTYFHWQEEKWKDFAKAIDMDVVKKSVTHEQGLFLFEDIKDMTVNGHSFIKKGDHYIDPFLYSAGVPQAQVDAVGRYMESLYRTLGMVEGVPVKKTALKNKTSAIMVDKERITGITKGGAVTAAAKKAAHSHKVKMGMAQKHFAKDKFGGGVVDTDWANPASKTKLNATGLDKVLSEKGWHTATVPPNVLDALKNADDVVAQKAVFDKLKKAPKGTPVPKPASSTAATVPDQPGFSQVASTMQAGTQATGKATDLVVDPDGLRFWVQSEFGEFIDPADIDDLVKNLTTPAMAKKGLAAQVAKLGVDLDLQDDIPYEKIHQFATTMGGLTARKAKITARAPKPKAAPKTTTAAPGPVPRPVPVYKPKPVAKGATYGPLKTHPEDDFFVAFEKAAKTVSVHANDKEFNATTIALMEDKLEKIESALAGGGLDPDTEDMLRHYRAAANKIKKAKAAGKALAIGDVKVYKYRPLIKDPEPGEIKPVAGWIAETTYEVDKRTRLGGSTGAVKVRAKEPGLKGREFEWVMKDYSGNSIQAENEYLANSIYNAISPNTAPTSRLGTIKNTKGKVSTAVFNDFKEGGTELGKLTGAARKKAEVKARENFVLDAWLANWDAVGLSGDNMMLVGDNLFRIDNGGALLFRAQGGLKGSQFGSTVGELETFLDKGINPSAANVYSAITKKDIANQIKHLENKVLKAGGVRKFLDDVGVGNVSDEGARKQIITALEERFNHLSEVRDKIDGITRIPMSQRVQRIAEVQVAKANAETYRTKDRANSALRRTYKQIPQDELF